MNHTFQTLEFHKIIELLETNAHTEKAKAGLRALEPYLSESELRHTLKDTTEARIILDKAGTPPLVGLEDMDRILITAAQGGCLTPDQLEYVGINLVSVRRLKDFLCRCKSLELSLAYYEIELNSLEDLQQEIQQKVRGGRVDDYASKLLKDLRQSIEQTESKIKAKAESLLKNQKECFSDSFVTMRSGHVCLPVKKDCKFKISGSVIDKSSTGQTLFIEPSLIASMNQELMNLKLDEENEERRILYTLSDLVSEQEEVLRKDIRVIEKLDEIFARGKLSFDMKAIEPQINTDRYIKIVNGRHPFLDQETCVPLNVEIGGAVSGVIITGPNTGGKTVAIKTTGLLSLMAQCGLHVPCEGGSFAMNNQILCDIGDGQNITENLSTFSAHITNVLSILRKATRESLVILDELGSGTDPTEGMGIAVAILEELRSSGCLFLATTHYPEVKTYAECTEGVINARMAFDRESLQPLYHLEVGEGGESCALYIAKRLGMPEVMLKAASRAAYGTEETGFPWGISEDKLKKESAPKIIRKKEVRTNQEYMERYQMGDCVMVSPEQKLGIVCRRANEQGNLQVQMKEEKIWVNHKRVKLHVKAEQMYPENYDFSIVFESVATRKAKHQMERKYSGDLEITL